MNILKFKYWNNKQSARGSLLLEVSANDILEADKELKEKTGLDVIKCPWIGCEILKFPDSQ